MKKALFLIVISVSVLGWALEAGAGQPKICICHNTQSKNHPKETISVALPAVCTHLRQHDDVVGACSESEVGECNGASQTLPEGFECPDCGGEGQDECPVCTDDSCDDGNPCTNDRCADGEEDSVDGCVHTPNRDSCDDGNACTTNDACSEGICAGGSPKDCDDGSSCTSDNCDPASGCTHEEIICRDGDQCTEDVCVEGQCPFPTVSCDDQDACTDEGCDSEAGCSHTPHNCDDHDACTDETCDSATGCVYTPHNCDDGDPCTDDRCDETDGCFHSPNGECGSELAGCIALPGNSPAVVTFSGPKKLPNGAFEVPFEAKDPDGDVVNVRPAVNDGSAEIVGNTIRFTLATPLTKDFTGDVEVSATASDSGSCQEKTFKTLVKIGVAGDQAGCSLIRP